MPSRLTSLPHWHHGASTIQLRPALVGVVQFGLLRGELFVRALQVGRRLLVVGRIVHRGGALGDLAFQRFDARGQQFQLARFLEAELALGGRAKP